MKPKIFTISLAVALVISLLVNAVLAFALVSSKNTEMVKTNQVSVLEQENSQLRTTVEQEATNQNSNSTSTSTNTTATTTTPTDESESTFASTLFDLKFNFDKSMGAATSQSNKTIYASNGALFCLSERISFAESNITLTLTKGYPECFGVSGSNTSLSQETLNTLDGKPFTFIRSTNADSSLNLDATYTSISDQYRGIRINGTGSTNDATSTEEAQLKQIVSTMEYNESRMLSDNTQNTITNPN